MKRLFKHPWLIIIVTLAVTTVLGLQLGNIQMDDSTRLYFPQKHDSYKRQYGDASLLLCGKAL